MLRSELFGNVKQNPLLGLIIILLTAVGLVFAGIGTLGIDRVHGLLLEFSSKYQDNHIYSINDPLKTRNRWKTFTDESDSLERLMRFHQQLMNNPHFQFLELNGQCIAVQDYSGPEKFAVYYEEGYADPPLLLEGKLVRELKGAQFNEQVFTAFNLKLESGRFFTAEEYNYSDSLSIPLILGSEYQGVYALGDQVSIDFLGLHNNARVVGFLKKDSYVFYRDNICYLDRRIIMPSLEFEHPPLGAPIPEYLQRFYDVKNTGYILSKDLNVDEVQVIINKICQECRLEPWWVNGSHISRIDILHVEGSRFFTLTIIISIIVFLFTLISINLSMLLKIKKNLRNYAVHLISGATVFHIKRMIGTEISFYLLSANMLAAFFSWRYFFYIGINPIPPLISIVLGITALIIPFRQIDRLNISIYLRGKR